MFMMFILTSGPENSIIELDEMDELDVQPTLGVMGVCFDHFPGTTAGVKESFRDLIHVENH